MAAVRHSQSNAECRQGQNDDADSTTNWHGGVHSPDDGYADPALAARG
ncbi:hypothetical protein WDV93_13755 [Pantoea ananatis]